MEINERIKKIRQDFCNNSNIEFAKIMEKSEQTVNNWVRNGYSIGDGVIYRILEKFPQINRQWLLMGEGEMLKDNQTSEKNNDVKFYEPEYAPHGKRLIPFYDDIASIGGVNGRVANLDGNSEASEWIDPGDWFKDATAAIRHWSDSMIQYPSGCILALKQVYDIMLLVPGKDYVIETSEFRITKKIQLGNDKTYIRAHSTNIETYPDGTLIHHPFDIPFDTINRIFEVLGHVVKTGGGTICLCKSKK